jgi:hypothetical protein
MQPAAASETHHLHLSSNDRQVMEVFSRLGAKACGIASCVATAPRSGVRSSGLSPHVIAGRLEYSCLIPGSQGH